jgi:exodeoxyribonuclease VII small subunit
MHELIDDLSFEEAFAELQQTVEELRGEGLTLERSLALFERGTALAGRCNLLLTTAELRVSQAVPPQPGGRQVRESYLSEDW